MNIKTLFATVFEVQPQERTKIALLSAAFFCVIGSYTVLRELRDSLFISIVGREYIQYAQILSIIILIPALVLFGILVDKLKKNQLLTCYSVLYGLVGLIIAYYVGHPTIGVANTQANVSRLFGWLQYLFVEGYPPFVISLFLSFVNSVTPPSSVAQSYSLIIAGSKLGGMAVAAFAWWFLAYVIWPESIMLQCLLVLSSILVMIVPVLIAYLMRNVPEASLHGYEASYKLEQQEKKSDSKASQRWYDHLFSGLVMMVRYPYAMGIFGLVFFWEIISVVLNFQRLGVCVVLHKNVCGLSGFLFLQTFWVHTIGFIIALIGSRLLLKNYGQRLSLVMVPFLTALLIIGYFISEAVYSVLAFYVLIRALNFSLAVSVREALYIPTTRDMRFKCKSWTDAFGAKFARGTGSFFSLVVDSIGATHQAYFVFCGIIVGAWLVVSDMLGRRFEKAIRNDEVIG